MTRTTETTNIDVTTHAIDSASTRYLKQKRACPMIRTTEPHAIDITAHAIDRASTRCLKQWKRNRLDGEGLHAWLLRQATDAMLHHQRYCGKLDYRGVRFVLERDQGRPRLVTVLRA